MNLVKDILGSYRSPRRAIRRQIDAGVREEDNLFYVMLFGVMNFLSHLPNLAKEAHLGEHSLASLSAAQFVASVFMMPLVLYAMAWLSHVVLRRFGGMANHAQARRALFWAALVSLPFVLILGITNGLANSNVVLAVSALTFLVFFWQWASALSETEFPNINGQIAS